MTITIINDCRDENALLRQKIKLQTLFSQNNIISCGVKNDLEAAGNLIDALDALGEKKGLIIVNVAPRGGKGKKWPNGSPFGFFYYRNTLVISSLDGLTLSLVKKLKLVEKINLVDLPTVIENSINHNYLDRETGEDIKKTQFRSYNFLPLLAHWLIEKKEIPSEEKILTEIIPDAPQTIWWLDNFGNAKTTLLKTELNLVAGKGVATKFGFLKFYDRLKDVPNGDVAIIKGSSGLKKNRWLEIVSQGSSAETALNLVINDVILK